jgi:hypothetical protein
MLFVAGRQQNSIKVIFPLRQPAAPLHFNGVGCRPIFYSRAKPQEGKRGLVMAVIEFSNGAIQIDARLIAEGLGVDISSVQARMREGKITSRCERGIDEDAGRHRLTFFTESCRLRLVVDETGSVVQRSMINFSNRPLPRSAHRPG